MYCKQMEENHLFTLIKTHKWDEFKTSISEDMDLNIQDNHMNYMVQYIILANQIEILKQILKYNVVIDWIDVAGKTILYEPIRFNYTEIIDILIEYDEHNIGIFLMDHKDASGKFPIHYALKFKNQTIFNKLLKKTKITILDNEGNTLLHLTVKMKSIDYIKPVIAKGVNINAINNNHESALHIACSYDLNNIIEMLIDSHIDTDIQENAFGFNGLMICTLNNNVTGVNLILKENCDVNLQDYNGNTAVHLAILENSKEILDKLHACTFNYNTVNLDGNTCLQLIFDKIIEGVSYSSDTVNTFIKNTILNIQNNEGKTVWHTIVKYKLYTNFDFSTYNNGIFIKDNYGITPHDLMSKLKTEEKNTLLTMIAESYYYQLMHNYVWSNEWENECKTKKSDKKKCLVKIHEMLIDKQQSMPIKRSSMCMNIDHPEHVSNTTFTGINFDVITSYMFIVKKHDNIMSSITDNFSTNNQVSEYYKKLGIIKDLNNEYLNFEIFWIFQQLIFPTNMIQSLETFKTSNKKLFVIPLAIELANGAHANCIIIDSSSKTVERFEPHGKKEPRSFPYNRFLLDDLLSVYFKQHLPTYKYLTPEDTQLELGFQNIENYETNKFKKIGDPDGFCVAWCVWYIEQRSKYDILPKKLAKKLTILIKSKNISFKQLIRKYSVDILEIRNNILSQIELDINDVRNNNLTVQQTNDLKKTVSLELSDI